MYGLISGVLVAGGMRDNEDGVCSIHCTQNSKLGHLQYVGKDKETGTMSRLEPAIMYIQVFHLTAPAGPCVCIQQALCC